MSIPHATLGRIRDVAARIKELEDSLMSSKLIPMAEQSAIHAKLRELRKEQDELEKRTR